MPSVWNEWLARQRALRDLRQREYMASYTEAMAKCDRAIAEIRRDKAGIKAEEMPQIKAEEMPKK